MLPHIKKLDHCFGQLLVRVSCACGACREIEPEALACLVGWAVTLEALAPRLRYSHCGKKAAEVVAVARLRPRGVPKNPHLAREGVPAGCHLCATVQTPSHVRSIRFQRYECVGNLRR